MAGEEVIGHRSHHLKFLRMRESPLTRKIWAIQPPFCIPEELLPQLSTVRIGTRIVEVRKPMDPAVEV
jgi:hypothetical protein